MSWGSENGFDAVRCDGCGLVYLDPWPDLSAREKALEFGVHPGEKVVHTDSRYRPGQIRNYARVLEVIYGPDDIRDRVVQWLDIGCGYGEFLETLAQRVAPQSVLRGSEPNLIKQAAARAHGLDVEFRELDAMQDTYTHVSLLNVFSHLPDPIAFLGLAKQRLREGGEILLQTGNGGDVSRHDFPGRLDFPDHLLFAGRRSLEVVFGKIGMEIVSIDEFPVPPFSISNVAKDLVKRLVRREHNPVNWGGPYRSIWVRARLPG